MFNDNTVPKDEFCVIIENDVKIGSFNKILNSNVKKNAKVNASFITDSVITIGSQVDYSIIESSQVGNNAKIGVFSHLRPNSNILDNAKIGNFVETKNCVFGNNSKASHLTYIGDAVVGENVNVGCGTIFCNYNGKIKQKTIVKDNVFIGSNSNLIAPVIIEENSFIAAGSTITNNVPKNTLAIARNKQINKENYYKG